MHQSHLALKFRSSAFLKAKPTNTSMLNEGQRKLIKHLFSHNTVVIMISISSFMLKYLIHLNLIIYKVIDMDLFVHSDIQYVQKLCMFLPSLLMIEFHYYVGVLLTLSFDFMG